MSPPPKKDWFLHMMVDSALCRPSISQLCKKSSRKPLFELVHDISPAEPPACYPFDMDVHIVNSKLYSLGGGRHIDDSFVPNLDVYCLDLTSSEGPSICEDPGICEGLRTCEGLRICEGPIIPKWSICEFSLRFRISGLVTWRAKKQGAEFGVYKLDEKGIPDPKPYQVLHELGPIFCPFLPPFNCHIGRFDDDRMWFVYDGKAADDSVPYTRVAVFRVSISNDSGGNSILSASLEAAELYMFRYFEDLVSFAFVTFHEVKHNKTEEKSFGRIIPHDHHY